MTATTMELGMSSPSSWQGGHPQVDGPGHGLPEPAPVVPHQIIRAFPELAGE
jgi:hypothetical protein